MFDYYKPNPALRCPNCFKLLAGWQGKAAENFLFVWEQHKAAPIEHKVDDDYFVSEADRRNLRLPEFFDFYADCQNCDIFIHAEGLCVEGKWRMSFIREPSKPFPSGLENQYLLLHLNLDICDVASRCGSVVEIYESSMTTMHAFTKQLTFGPIITLEQDKNPLVEGSGPPLVFVDAYDAVRFGFDKLYWGALHALNISKNHAIAFGGSTEELEKTKQEWAQDAREIFEHSWMIFDQKTK